MSERVPEGFLKVLAWEAALRYVENSPVYYLDRVETPLIIQAGAADTTIINHSDEVWVGLQRLNKNVTYLRYGGEGHVLASAANLRDYWKRVLSFFDEHLRRESAVPGGETGQPARRAGRRVLSFPLSPEQARRVCKDRSTLAVASSVPAPNAAQCSWITSGTPVRPRWKSVDQHDCERCSFIKCRPAASTSVRS